MNMKKILLVAMIAMLPALMYAQSEKDKARFAYVSTQMNLNKDVKAKLQPLYYAYLKELHAAKDIYDNMKAKYATQIKKNTLTAEQANSLNNARWQSDAKVLEVRKAYTQKFKTVLTAQQVYFLFSYSNDSKSKMKGK